MLSVATNPDMKNLTALVPARLAAEVDDLCARMGLVKQRVVAAALADFVEKEAQDQADLYVAVYQSYYAAMKDSTAPPGALADAAEDALGRLGKKRRPKTA